MEQNIELESVMNRKLVFEVRFKANPLIIDNRGRIAQNIVQKEVIKDGIWEIGNVHGSVTDIVSNTEWKQRIHFDSNKFNFISLAKERNDDFFNRVMDLANVMIESMNSLEVLRIGFRIQGTYRTKSTSYSTLVQKFLNKFPDKSVFKDFEYEDIRIQLNYKTGFYMVGPTKKDDNWFLSEFKSSDADNDIGLAIDTDNFLRFKDKPEKLTVDLVTDLMYSALAVEKRVFESYKDL